MDERTRERADKISEFFGLGADTGLLTPGAAEPKMNDEMAQGLDHFQIEWHVIPRAEILALDDSYFSRFYTHAPRDFTRAREHKPSYRDVLVKGLHEAGWKVDTPKASMYVWAKIPDAYAKLGSLEFSKHLLAKAKVSVSPGIGFGEFGDGHVRFAMIENEPRTRQAIRGIKQMFREDGLL